MEKKKIDINIDKVNSDLEKVPGAAGEELESVDLDRVAGGQTQFNLMSPGEDD